MSTARRSSARSEAQSTPARSSSRSRKSSSSSSSAASAPASTPPSKEKTAASASPSRRRRTAAEVAENALQIRADSSVPSKEVSAHASCLSPKSFPNKVSTPPRLRASLFRSFVLADFVTMANAVCGVSSIFLCLNYLDNARHTDYLIGAFVLQPLALLFDIADGWVARKRKSHSPWGSDLDSLADVISFVVTPAVLGFTLGLRGMWDSIILSFFVFCGVARLARYNVTSSQLTLGAKVPYYEGFPVPTSLLIVAMWAFAFYNGNVFQHVWGGSYKVGGRDFHPLSVLYFVWGCLFVSASVRIPKP